MKLFDLSSVEHHAGAFQNAARIPAITALEADFPAATLSRLAESESWRKEVQRPATSTHKWWAKRLGSIFRGILVAATVGTCEEALRAYTSGALLDGLVVFDPFAGSGVTLVEAIKLGARTVGHDINPVATLVQRQALQAWDIDELDRAFGAVEAICSEEIGRFYRTETGDTVLYYFWVALADCHQCGTPTRLFSTHAFAKHVYPTRVAAAHLVCPLCLDIVAGTHDFERATCRSGHRFGRDAAVKGGAMTCPKGHKQRVVEALGGIPPRYELYAKVVLGADHQKRYEAITPFDKKLYDDCAIHLIERGDSLVAPRGMLDVGENTRQATRWGFRDWRSFFNARQLYALGLLGATIRDLDAGPAEREALATLFSGTLEFNNRFCSFKGEGTGAVRHMFSHHVLRPERMPLEAHPWGTPSSSGAFSTLYRSRLRRAYAYKKDPFDQVLDGDAVRRVRGVSLPLDAPIAESWDDFADRPGTVYLRTGDSSGTDMPDESVDLIITDPPYMDNVHYSELADFFHSWLVEIGPFDRYPSAEPTTRHPQEVQSASPEDFGRAVGNVWRECARVMKPEGLLAFTFHQSRLAGWTALVAAVADADLVVTAIQPVKGEMSTSSTKHGKEPSNLDSIVVCRKASHANLSTVSDPVSAAELGARRLRALRDAGIQVGAGDVRSVIRGHVLATFTADPGSLDVRALGRVADELASEHVAGWTRAAPELQG